MLGDDLAYIALVTRDIEALTSLLGARLGLSRTDLETASGEPIAVYAVGASALAVVPTGHAFVAGETRPGVHHIGLTAADMPRAVGSARTMNIGLCGAPEPALGGGVRQQLDTAALAGVATWLVPPLERSDSSFPLIQRIDHIGIASGDNTAAVQAWVQRLGRPLESQQTDMEVMVAMESFTSDKWGVVYHSRPPVPVGGLRVSFVTVGDTELEFLQNFNPAQSGHVDHGSSGNTRQDQGAIAKYVAARGPGLHHVAFKTQDIDGVLAKLETDGVALIDKRGRPGSRRGRIGFIHPKATGGVLLHFVERPGP